MYVIIWSSRVSAVGKRGVSGYECYTACTTLKILLYTLPLTAVSYFCYCTTHYNIPLLPLLTPLFLYLYYLYYSITAYTFPSYCTIPHTSLTSNTTITPLPLTPLLPTSLYTPLPLLPLLRHTWALQ